MKIDICLIVFIVCFMSREAIAQSGFGAGSDHDETSYEFEDKAECITFTNKKCQLKRESTFFRKNCTECECKDDEQMICCSLLKKPIDWPIHCYVKLNRRKCEYELRQLDKPHLRCNNIKPMQTILDTERILHPDE